MDTPMTEEPPAPTPPPGTASDPTAGPPPPPSSAPRGDITDWFASLARSTHDRMAGGVAGGLALRLGLPSWLVRAGFVIAATLGFGIPLYVLAWALVPDDRGGRLFGNRLGANLLTLGALLIGSFVLIDVVDGSGYPSLVRRAFPWLLVLGGLVLLLRRADAVTARPPADPAAAAGGPIPAAPSPGGPAGPAVGTNGPFVAPAAPPAALPPRPRRVPVVGLLTWCAALVAVAATGVFGLAVGTERSGIGPGVLVAVVMIVLGAGLTFSAVRGRARGLILPALAVGSLLLGLTALDVRADTWARPFDRRITDGTRLPDTLTAATGSSTLDLSELRTDTSRTVEVRQTTGHLSIIVPRRTNAVVRVRVRAGDVTVERPSGQSVQFDADLRDRWLRAGVPAPGALLTTDDLRDALQGRFALSSNDTRASGTFRFDRRSEHRVTVDIEMGLGDVQVLDPVWADLPDRILTPVQLCTVGGGPRGVVQPCPEVPEGSRVALCLNDGGNLVDCREDRPGTVDNPRIAACRDATGEWVPCDTVGVDPVGAELISPVDPTIGPAPDPLDPNSEPVTDPTDPTGTIAPPSAPATVPPVPTTAVPTTAVPTTAFGG